MKHINIAIENMNNSTVVKDEENLSIIERIVQKTGNPKIAAVLALDLFLVGVDTVSGSKKKIEEKKQISNKRLEYKGENETNKRISIFLIQNVLKFPFIVLDIGSSHIDDLSIKPESR